MHKISCAIILSMIFPGRVYAAMSEYYSPQFGSTDASLAKIQKEKDWEEAFIAQLTARLPEMEARIRKAHHPDARTIFSAQRAAWIGFIDERKERLRRLKGDISRKEDTRYELIRGVPVEYRFAKR